MLNAINKLFRDDKIKLFILIVLSSPLVCLNSCAAANKIDTTTQKKITSPSVRQDTTEVYFNDSVNINADGNDLKLIFLKEKNDPDYWKYFFPIFTLLLGIAINKLLDFFYDRKKTKRAGKRWVAEIRSLQEPIAKQIGYIDEFLAEHNKETFVTPTPTILSVLGCEIFKSLDKSELLKYIEFNRRVADVEAIRISNRTHGFVAILTNAYEMFDLKFTDYLRETSKYATSLNQGLQSFMGEFRDYGVALEIELNGDPIQSANYKAIFDLVASEILPHSKDGKYDVFVLRDRFFIPLLPILADLRFDERTKPLATAVSNCLNSIRGIGMEKVYFKEILEKIKKKYERQQNEIGKVVSDIEGI